MADNVMNHEDKKPRRMNLWKFSLCLFFTAILPGIADATPSAVAKFTQSISTDPASGIQIKASSAFSDVPSFGMFPLIIEITNATNNAHSWQISITAQNSSAWQATAKLERSLTVGPRSRQKFELLVPLISAIRPTVDDDFPNNLYGTISGYGVDHGHLSFTTTYKKHYEKKYSHYIAVSENLGLFREEIATHFETSGNLTLYGSVFNPGETPGNWKALAGVVKMFLTENDLLALSPQSKTALRDWLFQGGKLFIIGPRHFTCPPAELEVPPESLTFRTKDSDPQISYGTGAIDCKTFDKEATLEFLTTQAHPYSSDLAPFVYGVSKRHNAGLAELALQFAKPELEGFVIMSIVLLYALSVGPLNLYVLTGKAKRYRLYITTPIIAVVTSAVISAFILLKEGTGGVGRQILTVFLDPQERRALVIQEQVSKTALLLNTGFDWNGDALITPVARSGLSNVQLAGSLTKSRSRNNWNEQRLLTGTYTWAESSLGDDFIQSRSLQAQAIETIVPTRAAVEIVTRDSSQVTAISSINTTLEQLFYIDQSGLLYQGHAVRPGERAALTLSSRRTFSNWLNKVFEQSGAPSRELRDRLIDRQNIFVAQAKGDAGFGIITHPDINWEDTSVTLFGTVIEGQRSFGEGLQ